MLENIVSKFGDWLDLKDSFDGRKRRRGYEHEIGAQQQKRIEIKMKKPDNWNYQGKVRLLRIEKREDRAYFQGATEMLARLEYNLRHNDTLRKLDEGRVAEKLSQLAERYDYALLHGWRSESDRIGEEIGSAAKKAAEMTPEEERNLIRPIPEGFMRKDSTYESVRMSPAEFQAKKQVAGKEFTIEWSTIYHYELVHPKRRQPKSFATVQDIFAAADHARYDQTQKGRKAKSKLYNIVALFCWMVLTVSTEIMVISGGKISQEVVTWWLVPAVEGVLFLFLLYFLVRAVMAGSAIFTVELKPILFHPGRSGPIPAVVDDEKLVDALLEMAGASRDHITEIGEILYSFQDDEFGQKDSRIGRLEAEKVILEQRIKENEEHEDLLTDTGRVRIKRVHSRWTPLFGATTLILLVLFAAIYLGGA